ncbi:hypothetical protein BC831DRAFT_440439 [Entophlyctis helioformis]|nr:hypothetical protein BC831DRAFT_440439 [Entophlyctis helioformis]
MHAAASLAALALSALLPAVAAQAGTGSLTFSNGGNWPAGTRQTVTLTITGQRFAKNLVVRQMELLPGNNPRITFCRDTYARSQTTISCDVVIPPNYVPIDSAQIEATWADCRDPFLGIGGPIGCSDEGRFMSPTGQLRILARDGTATTVAAATSTVAATTSTVAPTTSPTRTVASATTTATESAAATETSSAQPATSGTSSSTALIIGGIFGGIAVLMLVAYSIWHFQRRTERGGNDTLMTKEEIAASQAGAPRPFISNRPTGPAPLDPSTAAAIKSSAAAAALATGVASTSASADASGRPAAGASSSASPSQLDAQLAPPPQRHSPLPTTASDAGYPVMPPPMQPAAGPYGAPPADYYPVPMGAPPMGGPAAYPPAAGSPYSGYDAYDPNAPVGYYPPGPPLPPPGPYAGYPPQQMGPPPPQMPMYDAYGQPYPPPPQQGGYAPQPQYQPSPQQQQQQPRY